MPKLQLARFPCAVEDCGKWFTSSSGLYYHTRTHTKPYHCDVCGQQFGQKSQLPAHQRRYHAGYHGGALVCGPCLICGEMFSEREGMNKRRKKGRKPSVCQHCEENPQGAVKVKIRGGATGRAKKRDVAPKVDVVSGDTETTPRATGGESSNGMSEGRRERGTRGKGALTQNNVQDAAEEQNPEKEAEPTDNEENSESSADDEADGDVEPVGSNDANMFSDEDDDSDNDIVLSEISKRIDIMDIKKETECEEIMSTLVPENLPDSVTFDDNESIVPDSSETDIVPDSSGAENEIESVGSEDQVDTSNSSTASDAEDTAENSVSEDSSDDIPSPIIPVVERKSKANLKSVSTRNRRQAAPSVVKKATPVEKSRRNKKEHNKENDEPALGNSRDPVGKSKRIHANQKNTRKARNK